MSRVVSIHDGNRTTVSDLISMPRMIPTRIIDMLENAFLEETILRDAGANSGLVGYSESDPLFLGSDVEEVAEFAEIPVAAGQKGESRIAVSTPTGLGIRISRAMRDHNQTGEVNRQITQLTNTMVRASSRALRRILNTPTIPTIAASAAWDTSAGRPRHDIAAAMAIVGSSEPTGDEDAEDFFGFEADTICMPSTITPVLIDNDDFLKVYRGNIAGESIAYTGKLPNDVMGMAGLSAKAWPKDRVLVVERGTVGFYSDSQRLEATEVYPEGNGPNGGPTQSFRSDVTRARAMGIDQPLAACWITGISS